MLGVVSLGCGAAPPPAPADPTCPGTEPLHLRIQELEAKVATLEARGGPETPSATSATPEVKSETEEERAARLDQLFMRDAPGGPAADAFETKYRRVFQMPSAKGAFLQSIQCNQRLCRAVVVLDSDIVHNRLFISAMREAGMVGHAGAVALREKGADGKTTVTAYIAQHGDIHND
jgi:hypothetical protein